MLRTATRWMINSNLGQAIKPRLAKSLARLGFELVTVHSGARQHLFSTLQRLSIRTVLDIGANQGQFAIRLRTLGYTGNIISLEPMSIAYRRLEAQAREDPSWFVGKVAIDRASGELSLNVSRNSTSSSVLTIGRLHVEAEPSSQTFRSEIVRAKTLDEVGAEYELVPPHFLKIDVQGNEIAVLDGARATLAHTSALYVESSLRELYRNSPTIEQVMDRLHEEGFVPIGIEPAFQDPRTGDLLQVDIMACRKELL